MKCKNYGHELIIYGSDWQHQIISGWHWNIPVVGWLFGWGGGTPTCDNCGCVKPEPNYIRHTFIADMTDEDIFIAIKQNDLYFHEFCVYMALARGRVRNGNKIVKDYEKKKAKYIKENFDKYPELR